MDLKRELYLIGTFIDGEFKGFVRTGRPQTIRIYTSLESAKRGLPKNQIHYKGYELKVFRFDSVEEIPMDLSGEKL